MKARAEAVYKRDKKSAARYLRYVAASSALNTTANLYTDIQHFRAQDYNHVGALLLTIAPVVLSIFPLFLIAVSKAADEMINVKPLEKVDVEEFKKQEEKRVSLLEAQNAYLEREAKAERKRIEIETVQKENALLRKGKSKQKPPQVLVRRTHRLMFSWPWQKTDVNEIAQLRETIEKLQEKLEQQKVSSVVSTKTKQSEKQNDGTSVAENETQVDTNPTLLEEMNAYLSAQDRSTETHSAVSPNDDTNHITFLHTSDIKNDTKSGCGKAAKAARYIRNNPNIAPSELAKKASISVTYARRLLQQKDA